MADVIKVSNLISNYALDDLVNTSAFIKLANKEALMPDFDNAMYTPGRSVDIRRPNRGLVVNDGLAGTVADITEKVESLTIDHLYNIMFDFDLEQLSLDINSEADGQRVYERYVKPQVRKIANKLDTGIAEQFIKQSYLYGGTAGTPINAYGTFADMAARMMNLGIPNDADFHAILSMGDGASLKKALSNIFNTQVTTPILKQGYIGELDMFQINQSQNIGKLAANVVAGDTAAVAAVSTSGDTTIQLKTIAASTTIVAGTKLTIAGHYMVNPANGLATTELVQFTVTADAAVTTGTATVTVYPALDTAANEWKWMDTDLAVDDVVTIEGSYTANIAMHPQALTLVCPRMKKIDTPYCNTVVDKEHQVSLQLLRQGDIDNMNNKWRLNLLCGHRVHPDYCGIIMG